MFNKFKLFLLLCVFCVFAFGIWLQTIIGCNTDVNWLLHATARFLNGGKYYYDFFEVSPPMILYLKIIPVLLAKNLQFNMSTIFISFVFILTFFSVFISYILLKIICKGEHKFTLYVLVLAITYVLVVFPMFIFGEREHLMLILTLPYFLLAIIRDKDIPIKRGWPIIVGLLAGIGFAIKPYFLISLIFIEIYLMIKKRRFFSWHRVETLIIGIILVLYLVSVFVFTPEYIYKVVPIAYNIYASTLGVPLFKNMIFGWGFFCILSIGFYICFREYLQDKALSNIFFLAFCGFICSFILQHTAWFYHAFPALAFAVLLMVYLAQEILYSPQSGFVIKHPVIRILYAVIIMVIVFLFAGFIPGLYFKGIKKARYSHDTNKIIQFVNNHGSKLFAFSTSVDMPYAYIDRIKGENVSRFSSQFFLPGLLRQLATYHNKPDKQKYLKYKKEFFDMMAQDFYKNKPDLIIVDSGKQQQFFNSYFNYIKYYSEDARFRKIIKNYKRTIKIGDYIFYQQR